MTKIDERRLREVALATDLYQMTMGASYYALGMDSQATFSLTVRKPPENRSFLVVAGIEEVLDRLISLRFDEHVLDYLRSTGQIRPEFIEFLRDFRFSGDVWAAPEGSIVFPDEPILEVQAPILEAQLAETLAINSIHYAMAVATKAARCRIAAPKAALIDFGLRRTPGIEAGSTVARSAYIVGFDSTSNLLAGQRFGIPVAGTVAHSFIEARPSEIDAFRVFRDTFPGPVTLLIDTYDTVRGAHHAVQVAKEIEADGNHVGAVRLDSGDLVALSREVRKILDDAGLNGVRIIASGGLDEFELERFSQEQAPIDGYGVGTQIGTSADSPILDMAYKLVEYEGTGRLKLSTGKISLVGAKQVWRRYTSDGTFGQDMVCTRDESPPGDDWQSLLEPVMIRGDIVSRPSLDQIRRRFAGELSRLPERLRVINGRGEYEVLLSEELRRRQERAVEHVREREGIAEQ
jgi:nicotinate phosphoribosyltransferase